MLMEVQETRTVGDCLVATYRTHAVPFAGEWELWDTEYFYPVNRTQVTTPDDKESALRRMLEGVSI